jgi:uncharacterized protein (DUF433 family)
MNSLTARITIDPAVCHGKPCVRGLRYPVEALLELLGSGMSHNDILADYEDLERDDLLAVLAYATADGWLQPHASDAVNSEPRSGGSRKPGV